MKKFRDTFRFVSIKQPLNKGSLYYLNDSVVGREVETSFDYLKFISVLYKALFFVALFSGVAVFIQSLNYVSEVDYFFYNFFCLVVAPIIFFVISAFSKKREKQCIEKLKKYEDNHWNLTLTRVKRIKKKFLESRIYFEGFENSIMLRNEYAKYLKKDAKVYVMTIDNDCSDILVIFDWNGETYKDRGFTVSNLMTVENI